MKIYVGTSILLAQVLIAGDVDQPKRIMTSGDIKRLSFLDNSRLCVLTSKSFDVLHLDDAKGKVEQIMNQSLLRGADKTP
jgi:hypothetical protein